MRITRILAHIGLGFPVAQSFSVAQAYSQIPQPVHLLGSTETNFFDSNFAVDIVVISAFRVSKDFYGLLGF